MGDEVVFLSTSGGHLDGIAERALFWRERLLKRLERLGMTFAHPKLEEALQFASMELAMIVGANEGKEEAMLNFAAGAILRHGTSKVTSEELSALLNKAETEGISEEILSRLAVEIRAIFSPEGDRRPNNRRYGSGPGGLGRLG